MVYRSIGLLILHLFLQLLHGQDTALFHPPMQIPMYLSGNFGEIRTDHFHSGIDIKTQGRTGHQVYSVEAGHVSRIKVQANGYGKSIYISHPNGYTSVYGHLDRYRDDIASYVKGMQYHNKSHTVDLYLKPGTFRVDKGELIAFSGNTGSSSGPHLHFEIRTSDNQHPTNVLAYNFNIKDRIAPRFRSLYLYPLDRSSQINGHTKRFSSRVVMNNGRYTLPYGTSTEAWGSLGISVEVFDYLDGASNRCGIYTLEMYVDDQLTYRHVMDEFSFSETRYINAHIDYEERIRSGTKAHRLHLLPNDRLSIYDENARQEALILKEGRKYNIRIVATDVAGNVSTLEFILTGKEHAISADEAPGHSIPMDHREANLFRDGPVRVEIPANALYQDLEFSFSSIPSAGATLTPFYQIASEEVAIHSPITLSIKCPEIDPALQKRLLLVSMEEDGKLVSAGGAYQDQHLVARLRRFGKFAVALDTIAPEIIFHGNKGSDLRNAQELRFTIRDELSGIARYEGYIDDHWALFEYDPKNERLSYSFDRQYITPETEHKLELYVSDEKGNVNLFEHTFNW